MTIMDLTRKNWLKTIRKRKETDMFCEKCGTRLEPGDVFCPECGNRVEAAPAAPAPSYEQPQRQAMPAGGSAWQMPAKQSGFRGVSAANLAGKLPGTMSGGISDFIPAILGVLMFIWTFLPFISINLGKLGEMASWFMDGEIKDLKFNLYQIRSTIVNLIALDGDEEAKIIGTVLTLIVVFVVVVALFAIASGVMNKKGMLLASGILSSVCLVMWLAYVIAVAHYKSVIFSELQYEIGYDLSGMVGSIHGIGLILLMITLAVHAFVSIRKATQM